MIGLKWPFNVNKRMGFNWKVYININKSYLLLKYQLIENKSGPKSKIHYIYKWNILDLNIKNIYNNKNRSY